MKREAAGHSKMRRLGRKLDIRRYQAIGIMEGLWLLTADEAPRGDIGKLTDDDIAGFLDYPGDQAALIQALVDSRWLDPHPVHRLIAHDWSEHSPIALDSGLARNGTRYADERLPRMTRLAISEWRQLCALWGWPDPLNEVDPGHLYLFQRASDNAVKIGITTGDVERRLGQVAHDFPNDSIVYLFSVLLPACRVHETTAHQFFRPYRLDGEWFAISPDTARSYMEAIQ